ncbi:hypothetical protein CDL15_Pgr021255 [Punica granatum]|uniref:Uncharacterized protein n=1 Tax=Punica granatum TaxID=22663 RepID=A0A218WPY3_PUNGR|nr:hypothetical protein CDL15_Pgr021255 [Punica granatum]
MMIISMMVMFIFVLLTLSRASCAERPYLPDWELVHDRLGPIGRKRMRNTHKEVSRWWSNEDYSLPHRRNPVHNDLEP